MDLQRTIFAEFELPLPPPLEWPRIGWAAARAAAFKTRHAPTGQFILAVLRRDWRFLAVTVLSCVVAATVATFQYAVFNSFRDASAVIPRVIAADYWVGAKSVASFDFPTTFSEDYSASLAALFPHGATRRVIFGFIPWRSPSGRRGNVALVGLEGWMAGNRPLSPTEFVANQSDLARLDLAGTRGLVEASIGGETLTMAGTVDSLSTYVGAPYVIADFATARRLLRADPTDVAFLTGTFGGAEPADWEQIAAQFTAQHPDVQLYRRADFAASSARYWLSKTGAGLAIGLAAVLAALLMVILLANGVLRFIQRYYQDLLSLLGHGANRSDVGAIVAGIATVIAVATLLGATAATPLLVLAFRSILPWVHFSAADLIAPLAAASLAFVISLVAAKSAVASFAPDAVFRT